MTTTLNLSEDDVWVNLKAATTSDLFAQMTKAWGQRRRFSADAAAEALMAREALASTAIGQAIAVPHARLGGLQSPLLALSTVDQPLPFGAIDGLSVKLFVFMLVPSSPSFPADFGMTLLSDVYATLRDPSHRQGMLQAKTPAELCQRFLTAFSTKDVAEA